MRSVHDFQTRHRRMGLCIVRHAGRRESEAGQWTDDGTDFGRPIHWGSCSPVGGHGCPACQMTAALPRHLIAQTGMLIMWAAVCPVKG